jgi:hypothetical protein
LVNEASARMVLAEALHTSTYVAVSPFITAIVIGSLFTFTIVYAKRAQLDAAALMTPFAKASEPVVDPPEALTPPAVPPPPAAESPRTTG